ncbi:MAG: outer membrane lipoprotein chaperone LolA [Gammaproteobacteria bacterium]|nr:outer membrane lipoprotein chaperone LolA [Gammaproteobacteria bacterium]
MKKILYVLLIVSSFTVNNFFSQEIAVFKNIEDDVKLQKELAKKKESEATKQKLLPPATQEFVDRINNIKSYSADFIQSQGGDNSHKLEGKFKLSRPNRLLWVINKPEKERQNYITNGVNYWHYDIGLGQVVVDKFDTKKLANSPFYFLLDNIENIGQNYLIEKINNNSSKNGYKLKLKPKIAANTNYLTDLEIYFDDKPLSPIIKKMSFTAGQSKKILITLSNVVLNSSISSSTFDFKVPKGVDVINASEIS